MSDRSAGAFYNGILSGPGLRFDFLPVIGSAVFRLSGNGIEPAPGLPPDKVQLSFFFLGELFIGNELFHVLLLMFHI